MTSRCATPRLCRYSWKKKYIISYGMVHKEGKRGKIHSSVVDVMPDRSAFWYARTMIHISNDMHPGYTKVAERPFFFQGSSSFLSFSLSSFRSSFVGRTVLASKIQVYFLTCSRKQRHIPKTPWFGVLNTIVIRTIEADLQRGILCTGSTTGTGRPTAVDVCVENCGDSLREDPPDEFVCRSHQCVTHCYSFSSLAPPHALTLHFAPSFRVTEN